jgi:hypothetical protein
MDYKILLKNRHKVFLEWLEPLPACGPEGNDLDAHVTLRATVHDCINMERRADMMRGNDPIRNDARRLTDFINVHWCNIIWPNAEDNRREASG